MKNYLNKAWLKTKAYLQENANLLVGSFVVIMGAFATYQYRNELPVIRDRNITATTVMITNLAGNSGGSGVVIANMNDESFILTNRHVCEVAKNGGRVISTQGQNHLVKSMRKSETHDLCVITASGNYGKSSKIAESGPATYDDSIISGHPQLLPNVITRGHFSGTQVIQVFTGVDKCTDEDMADNKMGMLCFFFGGIPVIKTYETVVSTAMIMVGSSGSAVYNSSGEISGLVFAGSGGLSYAYIVPFEYVKAFLSKELHTLKSEKPNYTLDVRALLKDEQSRQLRNKEIIKKCEQNTNEIIEEYCNVIVRDLTWRENVAK